MAEADLFAMRCAVRREGLAQRDWLSGTGRLGCGSRLPHHRGSTPWIESHRYDDGAAPLRRGWGNRCRCIVDCCDLWIGNLNLPRSATVSVSSCACEGGPAVVA